MKNKKHPWIYSTWKVKIIRDMTEINEWCPWLIWFHNWSEMIRTFLIPTGFAFILIAMSGCSNKSGLDQSQVAANATASGADAVNQMTETTPKLNKKGKIKDPTKIKRADKPKKKPNMVGWFPALKPSIWLKLSIIPPSHAWISKSNSFLGGALVEISI